jgi:hypothetical protein
MKPDRRKTGGAKKYSELKRIKGASNRLESQADPVNFHSKAYHF